MSAERDYLALAEALVHHPDVKLSRMFSSEALSVKGKIFAMLNQGRLVVKLPADRVEALVASGEGRPFEPGPGRVMREWIALKPANVKQWRARAEEARDFVASVASSARPRTRSGKGVKRSSRQAR